MTWDTKDLTRTRDAAPQEPLAPPVVAPPPPRQQWLARWAEMASAEPPMELRRAMWDLGLVDDATWAEHTRLMTRGIPEL